MRLTNVAAHFVEVGCREEGIVCCEHIIGCCWSASIKNTISWKMTDSVETRGKCDSLQRTFVVVVVCGWSRRFVGGRTWRQYLSPSCLSPTSLSSSLSTCEELAHWSHLLRSWRHSALTTHNTVARLPDRILLRAIHFKLSFCLPQHGSTNFYSNPFLFDQKVFGNSKGIKAKQMIMHLCTRTAMTLKMKAMYKV